MDSNSKIEESKATSTIQYTVGRKSQGSCNRTAAGSRREEMLFPGKPNDTLLMKSRPGTSFQFKGRQHTSSQHSSSGLAPTLKVSGL